MNRYNRPPTRYEEEMSPSRRLPPMYTGGMAPEPYNITPPRYMGGYGMTEEGGMMPPRPSGPSGYSRPLPPMYTGGSPGIPEAMPPMSPGTSESLGNLQSRTGPTLPFAGSPFSRQPSAGAGFDEEEMLRRLAGLFSGGTAYRSRYSYSPTKGTTTGTTTSTSSGGTSGGGIGGGRGGSGGGAGDGSGNSTGLL